MTERDGAKELDKLILRGLLIDGECFIRIRKSAAYKYGVKFELLDPIAIDPCMDRPFRGTGEDDTAVFMGIEVDRRLTPVAYWYNYAKIQAFYGKHTIEKIPASEVIHLYKKNFVNQLRGYSPLNASLADLQQLSEFQTCELFSAKGAACIGLAFERNNQVEQGNFYNDPSVSPPSPPPTDFTQKMVPGMNIIVPAGYNAKVLQSNHPTQNFDPFVKSVLTKVAASLGVSYNKLCKDMTNVNFSSLKYAAVDEQNFFEDWQSWLIENWKEVQFKLFVDNLLMNTSLIKPSQAVELMRCHNFIGKKNPYFEPGKEALAKKTQLQLGLTNPYKVLEEMGVDPQDNLDDWQKWIDDCRQRGLSFNYDTSPAAASQPEHLDTQEINSDDEELNKVRD